MKYLTETCHKFKVKNSETLCTASPGPHGVNKTQPAHQASTTSAGSSRYVLACHGWCRVVVAAAHHLCSGRATQGAGCEEEEKEHQLHLPRGVYLLACGGLCGQGSCLEGIVAPRGCLSPLPITSEATTSLARAPSILFVTHDGTILAEGTSVCRFAQRRGPGCASTAAC